MAPVAGGKATSIITKQKIVGLVTDVEYCLTFWARSSVANQPLRAYFYADDNVKPHWYKKKDFTVTANWEKYVFLQKIPPDEEWNRRALYIRFDIPYGEVFLDEAALEPNTSKRE